MRFSNMVDYKNEGHFVVKTGRKNIRILKPGEPYDKSFVVPLKKVGNRRPADVVEPDDDNIDETVDDLADLVDPNEETEDAEDEQFQPQ